MRILIDINHPAHVHYFRNFIIKMKRNGHSFIVMNRDDKLISYLLDYYGIEHIVRNARKNNSKSRFSTVLYLFVMTYHVWRQSRKTRIDAYLGFASSSCAIVSRLMGRPSILLDDTEHNKFNHALYRRFSTLILTPYYFMKKIRDDQVYFDAYIEQLYLSKRDKQDTENYIFIRFIAYDAGHDSNIDTSVIAYYRNKIIEKLKLHYKLIISCESEDLQKTYKEYSGAFAPEEIHEVMRNAKLVISDGATMASEAGVMGVAYVYTNPLAVGYIEEQIKTIPNSFRMSYKELNNALDDNINFFEDSNLHLKTSLQFIDPTEMLLCLFSDLDHNISNLKGKRINHYFLEQMKLKRC